ncbi:MAG: sigma-70 family RNA polymerase sigma factor [Anaerolineae bacterium]|nr:sigma-70 family RNA polymerase sigma factor [Anaerolineae bacterium]
MASSEQQLIQRARRGDVQSFNELVLIYQDQLYSLAYRIMGDSASAADAAQDALITAFKRLNTYRGGNFRSWLIRITTNTCYDELRRRQRRPADSLEEIPGAEYDDGPPIPDDSPTPEEVAQDSELSSVIEDCINALGTDQRTVLILSDIQGMGYQEIADVVNANLGTVKSRLSRARVAVRDCLQAFQELLPPEFRLNNE